MLLVVVSLFVGVVAGIAVAALLISANVHPAYGIAAGGAAFGAAVSLVLKVFAALAWL